MTLEWTAQPLTRAVARSIRSGTRITRPYLDGHRFDYSDLNEVWATPDQHHVVLTHGKDPIWQYWRFTEAKGWQLMEVASSRKAAQAVAEVEHVAEESRDPGTYVVATKEGRTLKVQCASHEGPEALSGIFTRMGYSVAVETVA